MHLFRNDYCISWISGGWVLRWLVGFDVPLRWGYYCLVGMWLGAAFLRRNKPNHSVSHTVLISTSEEQPDDGHPKAETCSCQQQPNFALQLNIRCVYDGPTYLLLHCSRHTTGRSHLKKGRLSCDSDAPQVGSARSDWTRVIKVNRRKTNRRKTRPYCVYTV